MFFKANIDSNFNMKDIESHCVLFNEFKNNIGTFWKDLQKQQVFCDITFACEDKEIKAHK